jgi:hypothetical protein
MTIVVAASEVPAVGGWSTRPAVALLSCPRCGLSIELKQRWLAVKHCPRCVARGRTAVEMVNSELPAGVLYATDALPPS